MSSPNDDPSLSDSTPPADSKPRPAVPSPLSPTPRANPPSVFNQKDVPPPSPADAPPSFNDFLAWMQFRSGEQAPAPPPSSPGQRSLLPKEQKKFHRAEVEKRLLPSEPATADEGASSESTGVDEYGILDASGGSPSAIRKRRKLSSGGSFKGVRRFLLPSLILCVLLYGSFELGRSMAPKPDATALAQVAKVQQDKTRQAATRIADSINQAMSAEKTGDFKKATDLLQQVKAQGDHVVGIDYQLAVLAVEQADFPLAMSLLDRSIQNGDDAAACYNLRGTLTNRTDGIGHGLDNLETATRLDPFNAKYFFFLGEALRRAGKPQIALVRLREAMDRLQEPTLEGIYNLKIRLTQIELGQENEFAGQLASELQQTPPSIDWLVTAAALEMRRGHFDLAATHLDKAFALADSHTVNARMRDFFFAGYADQKQLARFFPASHGPEAAPAPAVTTGDSHAPSNTPAVMNTPPSAAPTISQ